MKKIPPFLFVKGKHNICIKQTPMKSVQQAEKISAMQCTYKHQEKEDLSPWTKTELYQQQKVNY
jgi:hypothetical protein